LPARRDRMALDRNCTVNGVTTHGHVCSEARGSDTGEGTHCSFQLP
jgi:hypothetical protein